MTGYYGFRSIPLHLDDKRNVNRCQKQNQIWGIWKVSNHYRQFNKPLPLSFTTEIEKNSPFCLSPLNERRTISLWFALILRLPGLKLTRTVYVDIVCTSESPWNHMTWDNIIFLWHVLQLTNRKQKCVNKSMTMTKPTCRVYLFAKKAG